jgi:hypothetical protein
VQAWIDDLMDSHEKSMSIKWTTLTFSFSWLPNCSATHPKSTVYRVPAVFIVICFFPSCATNLDLKASALALTLHVEVCYYLVPKYSGIPSLVVELGQYRDPDIIWSGETIAFRLVFDIDLEGLPDDEMVMPIVSVHDGIDEPVLISGER